jgi:hypothetical protein
MIVEALPLLSASTDRKIENLQRLGIKDVDEGI